MPVFLLLEIEFGLDNYDKIVYHIIVRVKNSRS